MSSKSYLPTEYSSLTEDFEREAKEAEADRQFLESVLKREINWSGYEQNGSINKKELGLLLDFDKQSASDQSDQLTEKGALIISVLFRCLRSIYSKEVIEYIVATLYHILEGKNEERIKYFHEAAASNALNNGNNKGEFDIYSPLLKIITSKGDTHNVTLHHAAHILALLFISSPYATPAAIRALRPSNDINNASQNDADTPALKSFIDYLITRITTSTSARDVIFALSELKTVLKRASAIDQFIYLEGFRCLAALLQRETQNAQLLYNVGFCLWLLSYDIRSLRPIQELGILKRLVSIVKVNVMEKVIRICYSVFHNLLDSNKSEENVLILEEMIGHGLVSITETLSKRKIKDNDLLSDMEFVSSTLQDAIRKLSTFEMYHSEVTSGNLGWSPVHTNEAFWRENIQYFEAQNYKLIERLISLLDAEEDIVREVAAFDLGEFARIHPDGKKIITQKNGKVKLMATMQNKNQKVAKQALLAIQKLMVSNWEFLSKSTSGGVASLVKK